jgi:cobalt-zinc-cadmium efflux system protein
MAHDHGHASAAAVHKGRLRLVFCLTLAMFAVEVAGGIVTGSLALLADAGHMLTDVAGIGLALLAIRFAARPASAAKSFGYYRVEILAAVINAVLLLGVAFLVLVEAWRRFGSPPEVEGGLMLGVALAGLAVNGVSLWLLRGGQRESLNVRGAYLEVMGDLLGSAAVVVAAAFIALTGLAVADPIASAVIALLILPRTWVLLRDAVDILLEATPRGMDVDAVRRHINDTPGVAGHHDLHVWTITSGMTVLSVHVVLDEQAEPGPVLDALGSCLGDHFDVEHSTFQLEPAGHDRHEGARHE